MSSLFPLPARAEVASAVPPLPQSPQASGAMTRGAAAPDRRLAAAAEQFEAMFITQMTRAMRQSVKEISAEGSIFRDDVGSGMLDFADGIVAQHLASQRAFGVADFIVTQMTAADSGTAKEP